MKVSRIKILAKFTHAKLNTMGDGKKFESQKTLINMINNDMYSLCIDINNKLFPGKLHFASCQV